MARGCGESFVGSPDGGFTYVDATASKIVAMAIGQDIGDSDGLLPIGAGEALYRRCVPLLHVAARVARALRHQTLHVVKLVQERHRHRYEFNSAYLDQLEKAGLKLSQMDVIELNEAFASQALAVTRDLGLPDNAAHVNPNGGAISLGHPLGASGARLVTTAMYQLIRTKGRYALCTMCIGVGQGIALIIERV